jgi:predicted ATPase/DNA-binding CsgD family transcriptional regulator
VGRERELAEVTALVGRNRLVTLTGPGGSGKTRLATEVARRLEEHHGSAGLGQVWLVELDQVGPDDVADAVAARLGEDRPGLADDDLVALIGWRRALLVLDNFEHLLSRAGVVAALVSGCPRLRVIVSSRAPLRVTGELVYEVPPLGLPPPGERVGSLAELEDHDAARLLLERIRGAGAAGRLGDGDAAALATICRLVDGLPLAIELAAVRTRVLAPAELVARLGRPLEVLTAGARDAPARHRTLRATIEWSFGLLTPEAQGVLTRLAVFEGPFTIEAAEDVAGPRQRDGPVPSFLDIFEVLVDHHLVQPATGAGGTVRHGLHPSVRELALERLDADPHADDVRERHAAHFLAVAAGAAAGPAAGDQAGWLDRLDAEREDLRAALHWFLEAGRAEPALRMAAGPKWFWFMRGHTQEGRELLGAGLRLPDAAAESHTHALALDACAWLAQTAGDFAEGEELAGRAVEILRDHDDRHALALALNTLGFALARSPSPSRDREAVADIFARSLALFDEADDRYGMAFASSMIGFLRMAARDPDGARPPIERSLGLSREIGDAQGAVRALLMLGWLDLDAGRVDRARSAFGEALELSAALGHPYVIAYSTEGVAALAGDLGDARAALRLAAAAASLRRRTRVAAAASLDASLELRLERAATELPEQDAIAARSEGGDLSLDAMLADARRLTAGHAAARVGAVSLTGRETEILRLVADGLTDPRIAARLRISVRTVHAHLRSVYTKLGVTSRVGATREAAAAGLL